MNRREVIENVSRISEVDPQDCDKVLAALEIVLNNELEASRGIRNVFDKIYSLMSVLKSKQSNESTK